MQATYYLFTAKSYIELYKATKERHYLIKAKECLIQYKLELLAQTLEVA